MKNFEDKFMAIQMDLVSLANEYVRGQAERIYIYGIADGLYSFNVFYRIHNNVVHKHQINDVLPDQKTEVDVSLQSFLLKEGVKDIKRLKDFCVANQKEHPTEIWLVYDTKRNSLDTKYSYEGRYEKNEELIPRLEFEKWFEEVSNQEVE